MLSSFIVGITFTVLIATGILAWGMLALGIFEAFGFLGASHLFGNFSLTSEYHSDGANGEKNWSNPLLKDKELETVSGVLAVFKFIVFPLIFLFGGITLIVLGNVGMIGLSLSFVLGIPSIVASLSALNIWMRKSTNSDDKKIRPVWRKFVIVAGILDVATFFILSLSEIFVLPVAIGFTLPIIGFDLWCFAMKCIECCVNNSKEINEDDLNSPISEQNNAYIQSKNFAYSKIPVILGKTKNK